MTKPMTAGELLQILQDLDPETIVMLGIDSEGNGHYPLGGFWTGACRKEPGITGCWSVGIEKLTPLLRRNGYTEHRLLEGDPAIMLDPM